MLRYAQMVGEGLARNPQNSRARFGEPLACSSRSIVGEDIILSCGEAQYPITCHPERSVAESNGSHFYGEGRRRLLSFASGETPTQASPFGFDSLRSLRVTEGWGCFFARPRDGSPYCRELRTVGDACPYKLSG